jgi:hypothetical protein
MERPLVIHPSPIQDDDTVFDELESNMIPEETIEKIKKIALSTMKPEYDYIAEVSVFDDEIIIEVKNANG